MATTEEMVKAVRAYALQNYNKDGWDYVVECWEDADIAEEIEGARTVEGAIAKVRKVCKMQGDYRAEIESTAW